MRKELGWRGDGVARRFRGSGRGVRAYFDGRFSFDLFLDGEGHTPVKLELTWYSATSFSDRTTR